MVIPLDPAALREHVLGVLRSAPAGTLKAAKRQASRDLVATYGRASAVLEPCVDQALSLLGRLAFPGIPPTPAEIAACIAALEAARLR